jgi:hypothetical protein
MAQQCYTHRTGRIMPYMFDGEIQDNIRGHIQRPKIQIRTIGTPHTVELHDDTYENNPTGTRPLTSTDTQ